MTKFFLAITALILVTPTVFASERNTERLVDRAMDRHREFMRDALRERRESRPQPAPAPSYLDRVMSAVAQSGFDFDFNRMMDMQVLPSASMESWYNGTRMQNPGLRLPPAKVEKVFFLRSNTVSCNVILFENLRSDRAICSYR